MERVHASLEMRRCILLSLNKEWEAMSKQLKSMMPPNMISFGLRNAPVTVSGTHVLF